MSTKAKTLVHFGPGAPSESDSIYRQEYPSKTSPGTIHVAQVNAATGLLSCGCNGWTNKREGKPRHCKHTKDLAEKYGLELEERDGQMFMVNQRIPRPTQPNVPPIKAIEFLQPMLASRMPDGWTADRYDSADFLMEEKYDGHRIVTQVAFAGRGKGMGLTSWSRGEKARTLPTHIAHVMRELPEGIYDGELIVPGGHSYDVTAGQNSGRERLVLFDLLQSLGQSTLSYSLTSRRALLETAYGALGRAFNAVVLAAQFKPSMKTVEGIWEDGGEGAIIKRRSSHYQPGYRSADWVKVKAIASATLTIIAYEPGKVGAYSAVKIRDDAGIETTVKTRDNATMRAMIAWPDSFIGRRLVISYQERTPSGKYRHPMWDHLL